MNKYNGTLVVISFLFFPRYSSAQLQLGIEGGISTNTLVTNSSNHPSTVKLSRIGYAFSIPFRYIFQDRYYLEIQPGFLQKNYRICRTDSLQGIYEQHNNTYVQLPILLGVQFGRRLHIIPSLGCYIAHWSAGHINGTAANVFSATTVSDPVTGNPQQTFSLVSYKQKYSFDDRRDSRIEFGLVAAGGLQYTINKRYQLLIQCSYYQSVTDQQKKYMLNQVAKYNRSIIFSFGGLVQVK